MVVLITSANSMNEGDLGDFNEAGDCGMVEEIRKFKIRSHHEESSNLFKAYGTTPDDVGFFHPNFFNYYGPCYEMVIFHRGISKAGAEAT